MRVILLLLALLATPALAQEVRISPAPYIGDTAWTPADASGAALSFTSPSGRYTKIGNSVTAFFRVTYPSTANGNTAAIGGLPVPSSANYAGGGVFTAVGTCFNSNAANTVLTALIQPSTSQVSLINNGGTTLTNTGLSTFTVSCVLNYISN